MFYGKAKKEALQSHENAIKKYNKMYEALESGCKSLYEKRKDSTVLIQAVETLVNSIANSPKEFERDIKTISLACEQFRETEQYAQEAYNTAVKAGVSTAAGVAGGAAIASLGPTAAMWVATTFGTASTGTAISSLTGAAATKAALAWLGGGALKVGGAGIVGGKALLALAGPIGWGIAGVATGVSVFAISKKNKKVADQAHDETRKITEAYIELKKTTEAVSSLLQKTVSTYLKLKDAYTKVSVLDGADYQTLSDEQRLKLGALVNNTLSLATLLIETIA